MWMPSIFQFAKYLVYFSDTAARADICWSAWISIIAIVMALLNVMNVPYVSTGKLRCIVSNQEIAMYPITGTIDPCAFPHEQNSTLGDRSYPLKSISTSQNGASTSTFHNTRDEESEDYGLHPITTDELFAEDDPNLRVIETIELSDLSCRLPPTEQKKSFANRLFAREAFPFLFRSSNRDRIYKPANSKYSRSKVLYPSSEEQDDYDQEYHYHGKEHTLESPDVREEGSEADRASDDQTAKKETEKIPPKRISHKRKEKDAKQKGSAIAKSNTKQKSPIVDSYYFSSESGGYVPEPDCT